MRHTPPQICSRCKELVPWDRKSCPIASIDTSGRGVPATITPPKSRDAHKIVGIITLFAVAFAFWMWSSLLSLKAYDLQAISREKAERVQIGMTHQQVIDLTGRDAVPIPIWIGFVKATDQSLRDVSASVKSNLEKQRPPACSLDRDDACGTYYTLKDGSGLRIIYHRGVVIYTAIDAGDSRSWKRF